MSFVRLMILGALLFAWSTSVFAADRITIYTVNYPLAYFAERIGGDLVDVVFPAPVDVDPAYWMPDQKTIAAYQRADLILLNGANYAKWIGKVSLPRSKIVDTSRKFKDRYVATTSVATHTHGSAGAHAHESLAFTTWLDLSLAKLQAEAIYNAMVRKLPSTELAFRQNYEDLAQELNDLDQQIRQSVAGYNRRPLFGSHPVYDYLAAGYNLNLKSVHWEPDKIPEKSELLALQLLQQKHKAEVMLWEKKPLQDIVTVLKKKGVTSVVFDPCGNRPEKGDFMTVMQLNVAGLANTFE